MSKIVEVAKSQLDISEVPKGSNWGPDIQKYLKSVGITSPAPWCMAFVYWCAVQSGQSDQLVKTGGVLDQWSRVSKARKFTDPKPGDIFIMDYGSGKGHTGIIDQVIGEDLHTIEGNTNDEGSREGFEVCRRIRKKTSCAGFIRLT